MFLKIAIFRNCTITGDGKKLLVSPRQVSRILFFPIINVVSAHVKQRSEFLL